MKHFLLSLFLFLNSFVSTAQYFNSLSFGKTKPAEAGRGTVVFDKEGNYYMTGSFEHEITFDNITLSTGFYATNAFIVKYSKEGLVVWAKHIKSSYYSSGHNVMVDDFNNVYLSGNYLKNVAVGSLSMDNPDRFRCTYIAKFTADGQEAYLKGYDDGVNTRVVNSAVDPAGNLLLAGIGMSKVFLAKFSPQGAWLWERSFSNPGDNSVVDINSIDGLIIDVKTDSQGKIFVLGRFKGVLEFNGQTLQNKEESTFLTALNSDGSLIWQKIAATQKDSFNASGLNPRMVVDSRKNFYIRFSVPYGDTYKINGLEFTGRATSGHGATLLVKYNSQGDFIWAREVEMANLSYGTQHQDLDVTGSGDVCLIGLNSGPSFDGQPTGTTIIIAKFSSTGKIIWKLLNPITGFTYPYSLKQGPNGVLGIMGQLREGSGLAGSVTFGDKMFKTSFDQRVFLAVITDSSSIRPPNKIKGVVFEDGNRNNLRDAGEPALPFFPVKAEPGPYFGLTDSLGNYEVEVDTGTYVISQMIPLQRKALISQVYPSGNLTTHQVRFRKYNIKAENINFGNQVQNCALLTVDIAADRRRRCMRSKTTVTYSNEGTADAQNVRIKVLYPRYVVPIKSSLAWTSRQDSVMIFDIGTLKAGERRSFVITDSTICGNEAIRGLSQCVKALISPKNTCISPNAEWDQSSVAVEASLTGQNQEATFTIANQGQGDMSDSTAYRLYANEALVEQGKVKLASGARARLAVPNPRATLRLEADQVPKHPGMSRPVASIQPAMVSPAMAAPSPVDGSYQDDADAEVSISCLPIIDSFDPNDKQVSPQGISRRHYIKAEDDLEYQIRFQNTGTDTAYTVVVKDTLSSYVDVASLQIGSASHPFTYTVSGKGRPVLTFTFKNINLPDHKKNEPASHGYVRFRIAQAPGNPKGTVIRNLAYNYFDFNSPIATNEVFNIIGDTIMAPPEPMLVYDCGKQMPTLALAGEEIRLCEASETVLQANAPVNGIGRWRLLSGQATLSDPANPQARLTAIGYGEVVLEWSIRLCEVVSRSQVKVLRYPIPAAPVIALPALQCEGSQLQPLMAAGSNITWYADAGEKQKLFAGNGFIPQIQATTTFYASQTVNGCESALSSVEVKIQPARISLGLDQDTLVAPPADSYQWYFNGQPIEGATGQKLFPRNTGSYSLQSTTQGCVSTSSAMAIVKNHSQALLSFGPNPTSGQLHLELTANETGPVRIVIRDRLGREIRSFKALKPLTVLEQSLELENLSAGLYLLEIQVGQQVLTRKFVQK